MHLKKLLMVMTMLLAMTGLPVRAQEMCTVSVTAQGPGKVTVIQDGTPETVENGTRDFSVSPGTTLHLESEGPLQTLHQDGQEQELSPSIDREITASTTFTYTFAAEPEPLDSSAETILAAYLKDDTAPWKEARLQLAKDMQLSGWVDEEGFLIPAFYDLHSLQWLIDRKGEILSRSFTASGMAEARQEIASWTDTSGRPHQVFNASGQVSVVDRTNVAYSPLPGYYLGNMVWRLSNTRIAFCGEALCSEPLIGDTLTIKEFTGNEMLRKALYYGFQGPEDRLSSRYNMEGAIVFTNDLISQAYSGTCISKEFGDGWWWTNYVGPLWNELASLPNPPANFKVYGGKPAGTGAVWNGSTNTKQTLFYWESTPDTEVTFVKESLLPALTNGNSRYSLDGAVYEITDASGKKVASFTPNVSGKNKVTLPAGTYKVKEVTPPTGYELDSTTYTLQVTAGQTAQTVTYKDTPKTYKPSLLVKKVDGSTPLADAQFTVRFYTGSSASGTPAKTWVLKSDKDGNVKLGNSWKVSGDAFYQDASGNVCLPYGILTIQETKAPEGYKLDSSIRTFDINGSTTATLIPSFANTTLKVDITKTQEGTDTPIADTVFIHTMPDGKTAQVTTNKKGQITLTRLATGTHKLTEKSAAPGYQTDTRALTFVVSQTGVTIKESAGWTISGTTAAFTNKPVPFTLNVTKENEGKEPLEGAEFAIYESESAKTPLMKAVTDKNGHLAFAGLDAGKTYWLAETKAPDGYLLTDNSRKPFTCQAVPAQNQWTFTYAKKDYAVSGTPAKPEVSLTFQNQPVRLGVTKVQTGTDTVVPGALFVHEMPDGTTEEVATDENGQIELTVLKTGTHKLTEKTPAPGYQADTRPLIFTASQNGIVLEESDGWITGGDTPVLENRPLDLDLCILKKGEKNEPLAGARFALYESEEAEEPLQEAVTDEEGMARFTGMEAGKTYWLAETKAPMGHVLPLKDGEPVRMAFQYDAIPALEEWTFEIEGQELPVTNVPEHPEATVLIVNGRIVPLPEAGSHWGLLALAGGLLCLAGAVIFKMRRTRS